MKKRKKMDMVRIHITIPKRVLDLYIEYSEAYQISVSAFLSRAGIQVIKKHKGDWRDKACDITNPSYEVITKSEFKAMTTDEKKRWIEQWR